MGHVLVRAHEDNHAVTVNPTRLENVVPLAGGIDALEVAQVERPDLRPEDAGDTGQLDVVVVLLVDDLQVEPASPSELEVMRRSLASPMTSRISNTGVVCAVRKPAMSMGQRLRASGEVVAYGSDSTRAAGNRQPRA